MIPLAMQLRIKYSFYATLVFILITHPILVQLLQNLVGGIVQQGVITPNGYMLQIVLFFLATLGLMMFPKDR
jgi:protein-S-isoprenylcysteine O-methyltransferase Ste14